MASGQGTTRRGFLKMTALGGGGAILLPHLAGCGFGGEGSTSGGDNGSLTFLSNENNPDTTAVVEKIFGEFEQAEGVSVAGEFLDADASRQRLASLLAAGEPPSVAKLDDTDVVDLAARGLLEPVSDVVESMGGVEDNVRLVLDGEDYLVPYELNFWMLFYRKDIFDSAGLAPPTDWASYLAAAEALTIPGGERYGNVLVSNPATGYTNDQFLNYAWSNGTHLFDWDGSQWRVALNAPENLQATAETLTWFRDRKAFSPTTTNYEFADVNQAYASGKVAMIEYPGARTLNYLIDQAPQVEEVTGVVVLPYSKTPARRVSIGGYCVFKQEGRDAGAARELTRRLVTGEAYLDLLWSVPGHAVPPSRELFEGEWRTHEYIQSRPDLLIVVEDGLKTQFTPVLGPWATESTPPNQAGGAVTRGTVYSDMVSRVVTEGMDPAQVAEQGAADLRAFVDALR